MSMLNARAFYYCTKLNQHFGACQSRSRIFICNIFDERSKNRRAHIRWMFDHLHNSISFHSTNGRTAGYLISELYELFADGAADNKCVIVICMAINTISLIDSDKDFRYSLFTHTHSARKPKRFIVSCADVYSTSHIAFQIIIIRFHTCARPSFSPKQTEALRYAEITNENIFYLEFRGIYCIFCWFEFQASTVLWLNFSQPKIVTVTEWWLRFRGS